MKRGIVSAVLAIVLGLLLPVNVYGEADNLVCENWFNKYRFSSNTVRLLSLQSNQAATAIYDGLINLNDTIDLSVFQIPIGEATDCFYKVLRDNPQIFYTDGFNLSYDRKTNTATALRPTYAYEKAEIPFKVAELNSKADEIIASIISPGMSEFQKERAIHDYIALNTKYDEKGSTNGSISTDSYNAYGVLVKGTGVCQGYSETLKLLLAKAGIESLVLASPEMRHAWNIVTLGGKQYHVDVTWNDPVPDKKGYVRYKYLNTTDAIMKEGHNWDHNKYPQCTDDRYSPLWDIESPRTIGDYVYYYSSEFDHEYIYKMNLNDFSTEQITNVRAPHFDIAGDWIYFSDYSNGGRLTKIKLDGTEQTILNNTHCIDVYKESNRVYYTEKNTGTEKYIEIESEDEPDNKPGAELEDYTGYKKWAEVLNVPADKIWTVHLNLPLERTSANNDNVYVKDQYGNGPIHYDVSLIDDKTIIVRPSVNLKPGVYYLYIENLRAATGQTLKENVKMKFSVAGAALCVPCSFNA